MTNKTLSIPLIFIFGASSLNADGLEAVIDSTSCNEIASQEKLRKSEIIKSDEKSVWVSRKDNYLLMYSCREDHIETYSSVFFSKNKNMTYRIYKEYITKFMSKYGKPAPIEKNNFKLEDLIFWETDIGIMKLTFRNSGSDQWATGYTMYLNRSHNNSLNSTPKSGAN